MTFTVGLFGAGHWARTVHGPAVVAEPGVQLQGVWARRPEAASALADELGCRAYDDVDALVADVDVVAVALPPDVQADVAARAAAAGKHLLLDKPLALTVEAADRVVDAVRTSGVASVVFFTSRFVPSRVAWLQECAQQDWHGAEATWVGSITQLGSPYRDSAWRHERGGLWDVGPHALSMTVPLLGPVRRVAWAGRDLDGTVRLVAEHDGGRTSIATLGLAVPAAAGAERLSAYGASGWTSLPERDADAVDSLREALRQLLEQVRTGARGHPCDVVLGADVVRTLAEAQALLDETEAAR